MINILKVGPHQLTNVIKDNIRSKNSRKEAYFRKNFFSLKEETLDELKKISSNEKTFINSIFNLKDALVDLKGEYDEDAITKFYLTKLKNGYSEKNMVFKDETDYLKVWGEFKDKVSHKFKKQEISRYEFEIVDFGDGVKRRLDTSDRGN